MRLMDVLAAQEWHFWIAPALFLGTVAVVLALLVGYAIKVFFPRYPRR
jgi:hypothetical protein